MDFIANQKSQITEMLKCIGIEAIEELFSGIPSEILLPSIVEDDGLSEFEGIEVMRQLAKKNLAHQIESYLGGGAYQHHIPAIVQAICQKSEFLTAYTPYQAEASQGMLQIIFEFQSAICALTGMDLSNASLYDGASACAEALLMALRHHKERKKIFVSSALNPNYRQVVELYLKIAQIELITIDSVDDLTKQLDENSAALLFQYPNFFGSIEDLKTAFKAASLHDCINIVVANPLVYALYENAEELGADIAVGDCQPLGIGLQFGGPYAGYISCKENYMRQLPGRIVGETLDTEGKRGFTLTMQAREQHIRREKATSNICTSQTLCALAFLITTLWYGPEGLKRLALTNYQRAAYLRDALIKIPEITLLSKNPHFNEFSIQLDAPLEKIISFFHEHHIEPGIPLKNSFPDKQGLLICVTETKNKMQLDKYARLMREAISHSKKRI